MIRKRRALALAIPLITTLAARAYAGERDLFITTRNVLARMDAHIGNRHPVRCARGRAEREPAG